MLWKVVRKERLNKYRNLITQLDFLKSKKYEILNSCGLKAYDYSKIKVMTGNGRKLTEQEQAVLKVEKLNERIKALESEILPDRVELEKQIDRLDGYSNNWRHAEALRSYYLDGQSKQETALRIYNECNKQDVKNLNDLMNTALELLAKVSTNVFVEVEQRKIEDWE